MTHTHQTTKTPEQMARITEVRRLAETRAAEISNGEKTLAQLDRWDREDCLIRAYDEYSYNRAEYLRAKQRGEDV